MGVTEETEVENPVVDATLVTVEAVGLEGLRSFSLSSLVFLSHRLAVSLSYCLTVSLSHCLLPAADRICPSGATAQL